MRYVIIGAGAVGGAIGGRLHQAGLDVVLVARGAHLAALRERGLRLTTPDGELTLPVTAVEGPDEVELTTRDVLVLAVKTQDSVAALDTWAERVVAGGGTATDGGTGTGGGTAAELLPLVCAQNGVESERLALRRFRRVYGMCVWLPSTFLEPGAIVASAAPYTGLLTIGRYPQGTDDTAREIAADLEKAVLLAPVAADVMRWKYAKLVINLQNAIQAICGSMAGPDARALADRVQAEATAVLDAAGIPFASRAEQDERRGDLVTVTDIEGAPRGGSSWQSLMKGSGSIETDYLNGEIVLLGRLHGIPTPVNETLCRVANEFARDRRSPGDLTAAQLAAQIPV